MNNTLYYVLCSRVFKYLTSSGVFDKYCYQGQELTVTLNFYTDVDKKSLKCTFLFKLNTLNVVFCVILMKSSRTAIE